MEIFNFTKVMSDEWLTAFEADGKIRSKFMKGDVVGNYMITLQ